MLKKIFSGSLTWAILLPLTALAATPFFTFEGIPQDFEINVYSEHGTSSTHIKGYGSWEGNKPELAKGKLIADVVMKTPNGMVHSDLYVQVFGHKLYWSMDGGDHWNMAMLSAAEAQEAMQFMHDFYAALMTDATKDHTQFQGGKAIKYTRSHSAEGTGNLAAQFLAGMQTALRHNVTPDFNIFFSRLFVSSHASEAGSMSLEASGSRRRSAVLLDLPMHNVTHVDFPGLEPLLAMLSTHNFTTFTPEISPFVIPDLDEDHHNEWEMDGWGDDMWNNSVRSPAQGRTRLQPQRSTRRERLPVSMPMVNAELQEVCFSEDLVVQRRAKQAGLCRHDHAAEDMWNMRSGRINQIKQMAPVNTRWPQLDANRGEALRQFGPRAARRNANAQRSRSNRVSNTDTPSGFKNNLWNSKQRRAELVDQQRRLERANAYETLRQNADAWENLK